MFIISYCITSIYFVYRISRILLASWLIIFLFLHIFTNGTNYIHRSRNLTRWVQKTLWSTLAIYFLFTQKLNLRTHFQYDTLNAHSKNISDFKDWQKHEGKKLVLSFASYILKSLKWLGWQFFGQFSGQCSKKFTEQFCKQFFG